MEIIAMLVGAGIALYFFKKQGVSATPEAQKTPAVAPEQKPASKLVPRLVIENTTQVKASEEITPAWLMSHGVQPQVVHDLAMYDEQGSFNQASQKIKQLVGSIWDSGQATGTEIRDFIFADREIQTGERLWFVLIEKTNQKPTVMAFIGKNLKNT